jgi:hypothetical protein
MSNIKKNKEILEQYHNDKNNYMRLLNHYKSHSLDYKTRRIINTALVVSGGLIILSVLAESIFNIKNNYYINLIIDAVCITLASIISSISNNSFEEQITKENIGKPSPTTNEVKEAEKAFRLSRVNKKYRNKN